MIEDRLEGVSLKDRHKNLNKLISDFKIEDFTTHFIESLLLGNQIDKIFLAALANRFKNATIVCELLKTEDEIVISKTLKNKWFFGEKGGHDLLNPTYFSDNIFPFVSFSTRCRIINSLSVNLRDQTLAEKFYSNILDKYGRNYAVKLLPVCSENFIRSEIEIKGFEIPELQLKYIYINNPRIIIDVLKKYCKDSNFFYLFSSGIFKLIIYDYPGDFIDIFNTEPFSCKIGYKTTLSLLKHDKQFVINNASKLHYNIDTIALLKFLKGNDRDQFFMHVFPPKEKDFYFSNVRHLFKYFTQEYQMNYSIAIYKNVYGNEKNIPYDRFPENFMEYLPIDLRTEWAKKKISEDKTMEEVYMKYFPIDFAIKRLMELNNSTPNTDKRVKILQNMINCCATHNDNEKLLSVLKYVAKRHRNDMEILRFSFLHRLNYSYKDIHKLSVEHWEIINEMIQIMIFNNDICKNYRQSFLSSILEKMILFKLNNNMEFESIIDTLMEQKCDDFNLLQDFPNYEKIVFKSFLKRFQPLIENKPVNDDVVSHVVSVLRAHSNMKNKISFNEIRWLLDTLKRLLTPCDDKIILHRVFYYIQQNPETKKIFAEVLIKYNLDNTLLKNALIHNIEMVYNNIDVIIEKSVESYSIHSFIKEYRLIKLYVGKSLVTKIMEYLDNKLKNEEEPEKLAKWINASCLLKDLDETERILAGYIPAATKIEAIGDPNTRIEYNRTETLMKNFKNIMPPLSFETVLNFSQNDYLKFGIPSLLHMSFKKTENKTLPFIKELSKKPVSVKKHSIRLAYFLCSKNESLSMYNEMWEGEKNSSIRDILFHRTFKIFKVETDTEIVNKAFITIKGFLKNFKDCDKNLFTYLTTLNVKTEYKAEYCCIAWSTLKMLEKSKINVGNEQSMLISSAICNMDILNEEFCETIINEYLQLLGNPKVPYFNSLSRFCISYLLNAKSVDTQNKHISKFCPIFQSFMSQKWDIIESRNGINEFLESFCKETISCDFKINPFSLLTSIYNIITSTIPFEAAPKLSLCYIITISLVELLERPLKIKSDELSPEVIQLLEQFSKSIINLYDEFVKTHGTEILYVFSSSLLNVLQEYYHENRFFLLHFIQKLLCHENKTKHFMLFLIDILPCPFSKDDIHGVEMQSAVVSEIASFNDTAVKIKLGEKFYMPLEYFVN